MGDWVEDLGMDSPKRRQTANPPIPRTPAALTPEGTGRPRAGMGYAPFKGPFVCKSRTGYWRPVHEYLEGRCVWCDKTQEMMQ